MVDVLESILYAARSGDRYAENQLFAKLKARISAAVQYKLQRAKGHPAEVAEDAKDVIAEIMATVFKKYKTAEYHHGFLAWLNTIIWYKVGDYIRAQRGPHESDVEVENLEASSGNSPQREMEKTELEGMIARTMGKLKEQCREIIAALLEERIKDYVSERMMIEPAGTVYARIFRCRQKFKEELQELGFDDAVYRQTYRAFD